MFGNNETTTTTSPGFSARSQWRPVSVALLMSAFLAGCASNGTTTGSIDTGTGGGSSSGGSSGSGGGSTGGSGSSGGGTSGGGTGSSGGGTGGSGSSGGGSDGGTPGTTEPPLQGASLYTPDYATASRNTLAAAFAADGDSLQSAAAPVRVTAEGRKADDPANVTVTKKGDGYTFKYRNAEVSFSNADFVADDGEYVKNVGSSTAYFGSMGGNGSGDISSASAAMVPLTFALPMNGDGIGSTTSNGFVNGFAIVGLETNPSEMPKSGSATYSGGSMVNLYPNVVGSGTDVSRLRYTGDATLTADFGAATVNGTIDVKQGRVYRHDGSRVTTDLTGAGQKIDMGTSKIVQNGFDIDQLTSNAAFAAELAGKGVAEVDVGGSGRFYGADAGSVGAIVSGGGTTHQVTGIITGDRN